MYEYENLRRIQYEGGATFIPVCPNCGRFVKADESIKVNMEDMISSESNATRSKCGRINMPFEGYIDENY